MWRQGGQSSECALSFVTLAVYRSIALFSETKNRGPQIFVHKVDHNLDDFVVLASDGLWDHVTNEEAVEIVRAAAYEDGDPKSAGDRLIKVGLRFFRETAERKPPLFAAALYLPSSRFSFQSGVDMLRASNAWQRRSALGCLLHPW